MIEIDLGSLVPREWLVSVNEKDIASLIVTVAEAARAKWVMLSSQRLHSSEQEYSKGISAVRVEGGVAFVTLDGVFPNMIEQGFSPFDMRDTLLGPNVPVVERGEKGKHLSKDGHYYRTIAFRMMGGKATGRNAQRTTDVYASELGLDRAKKLGQIAERRMKKLSATQSNPGGPTAWGQSLAIGNRSPLAVKGHSHKLVKLGADAFPGDQPIFVPHGGAEHKSPIFEGAYRFEQAITGGKAQNTYGTFRTISTGTTEGWIHPGFMPGAHLAEEANEYALRLLASYFKALPTAQE